MTFSPLLLISNPAKNGKLSTNIRVISRHKKTGLSTAGSKTCFIISFIPVQTQA
jgi:hypothetical protein